MACTSCWQMLTEPQVSHVGAHLHHHPGELQTERRRPDHVAAEDLVPGLAEALAHTLV